MLAAGSAYISSRVHSVVSDRWRLGRTLRRGYSVIFVVVIVMLVLRFLIKLGVRILVVHT